MKRVLIANRGEVVRRIHRTASRLGLDTVAVFTAADRSQPYLAEVTRAIDLGDGPLQETYLSVRRILDAAQLSGADALHPGYGFLAENADFAQAVIDAGITFIGPAPELMRELGRKDLARAVAERCGVPIVAGYHGADQGDELLFSEATKIGPPLLIKAVAGGGGRGVREVHDLAQFQQALLEARAEAAAAFGDDRVILERLIGQVRHIEVQLIGDSHGNVFHLFERDCTAQRRRQKLVEETPAPYLPPDICNAMLEAAVRLGRGAGLTNATTVEFVVPSGDPQSFYFIEANTRLQVEHPVTELVTGLDIVELQFRSARGDTLSLRQEDLVCRGHAIEARLCAEMPQRAFLAATGEVRALTLAEARDGVRIDHSLVPGLNIGTDFDSLLAKVIAWAPTRETAIQLLDQTLDQIQLVGLETNLFFLRKLIESEFFRSDSFSATGINTQSIDSLPATSPIFGGASRGDEVAALSYLLARVPGLQKSLQSGDPFAPRRLPDQTPIVDRVAINSALQQSPVFYDVSISSGRGNDYELLVDGKIYSVRSDLLDLSGKTRSQFLLTDEQVKPLLFGLGDPATDSFKLLVGHLGHSFFVSQSMSQAIEADTEAACASEVRAHLPALVIAVNVAQGQTVQLGEPLVVLESMKMQHTIVSPQRAVVKEILVQPGAKVKEGQMLLVFE